MSGDGERSSASNVGADRELWDGPERSRAIKLIQGYVWHPREEEVKFTDYVPSELSGGAHVLIDEMPRAPFTFFGDGTLSATQKVYQLTVLKIVEPGQDPRQNLAELAEELQAHLETTPKNVGWQLMDDLREVD